MRSGIDSALYVGYAVSDAVLTFPGTPTTNATAYAARTHEQANIHGKPVRLVKVEVWILSFLH